MLGSLTRSSAVVRAQSASRSNCGDAGAATMQEIIRRQLFIFVNASAKIRTLRLRMRQRLRPMLRLSGSVQISAGLGHPNRKSLVQEVH